MMRAAGLRRGRFPPRAIGQDRGGGAESKRPGRGAEECWEPLVWTRHRSRRTARSSRSALREVPDLAHRLTLPEADTERALRRLERQGLAAQSSARTGRWVAAPPGVALGALLTQQRHELEQAELTAALLAEEYRAEATEPAVHDLVEVVTGASAVAHRFVQLQLGAAEEVCALVTGNPIAITGTDNEAEERAATRGVTYRVVIERAVLALPTGIAEVSAALGREEQVRVVEEVPTKLVVADRTIAMAPLTDAVRNPRLWSCTRAGCWSP